MLHLGPEIVDSLLPQLVETRCLGRLTVGRGHSYLLRVRVEDVPPVVFFAAVFFAEACLARAAALGDDVDVFLAAAFAGAARPADRFAGEVLFTGLFLA
ncbi:hypothetical protein, partial [Kitasatospora indigofera]|uniref:hypothetical protein n=1 Tax=Kitasatospora indigofera TaxID=67307 RepID=UPI001E3AA9E7